MKQSERRRLWKEANKHRGDCCEACGKTETSYMTLATHHITRRLKSTWWKQWNLMTLCFECHQIIHSGKKVNGKFLGGQAALRALHPNRAGYLRARFEDAELRSKGGRA